MGDGEDDGDRELTATEAAAVEAGPESPTDLEPSSWKQTAKRVFSEFQDDNITDWAAALTYYAVLSLFPGLLVLVSLLGIFGQQPETTDALLDIVRDLGPESAVDTFAGPIEDVTGNQGGAGVLFSIGLLGALFSASGYIGAFARASNAIYEVEEGRPFWKMRPQQIGMTLIMVLLLAFVAIALVVSGPLAEAIGEVIGLGDTAVTTFRIIKWPLMLVAVAFMFAVLYYWAPNVKQPKFRWVSAGSLFAVGVWVLASVGFAFYVGNFGNYNATYGSLGGVIIFLLWIWITQIAILLGQELNAELERQLEIESGAPGAEREIQRPERDPP